MKPVASAVAYFILIFERRAVRSNCVKTIEEQIGELEERIAAAERAKAELERIRAGLMQRPAGPLQSEGLRLNEQTASSVQVLLDLTRERLERVRTAGAASYSQGPAK